MNKKVYIAIGANIIFIGIFYLLTAFVQWELPVNYGDWNVADRGFYIMFLALFLLMPNIFIAMYLEGLDK